MKRAWKKKNALLNSEDPNQLEPNAKPTDHPYNPPVSDIGRKWNRATTDSSSASSSNPPGSSTGTTRSLYTAHTSDGFTYDSIDMSTLCVGTVPIQVEKVPKPMLEKIQVFYVCAGCGKVFWEGSHFEKVREQFDHIIEAGRGGAGGGAVDSQQREYRAEDFKIEGTLNQENKDGFDVVFE